MYIHRHTNTSHLQQPKTLHDT